MSCTKGVCNVCVYACECVGRWNVARLPIVHIGCLGTHLALGRETTWMRTAIRECEHVIRVLTCEDTSNSNTRILYYMFGCLGIVGCHIIVRLSYYLVAGMPYFKHIQLQNQVFSYFLWTWSIVRGSLHFFVILTSDMCDACAIAKMLCQQKHRWRVSGVAGFELWEGKRWGVVKSGLIFKYVFCLYTIATILH